MIISNHVCKNEERLAAHDFWRFFQSELGKGGIARCFRNLDLWEVLQSTHGKSHLGGRSGFGGRTAKGGKGENPTSWPSTVIHGWGGWGKDLVSKTFSLPEYIQHDVVIPVFSVAVLLGKKYQFKVRLGWIELVGFYEACKTIGTFGVRQWNLHPFFPGKGLTYFHWEQICPLGSLNQSALRVHKQKPANQVRSDQEGHLQGSEY